MACSSTAVKFHKSNSLVQDAGTLALSCRLKEEVQKLGFSSFHLFLEAKKHKLFHLYKKRNCCQCTGGQTHGNPTLTKHQWNMLFTAGSKPCNKKKPCLCQCEPEKSVSEDDLDLTLLCSILQNLCSLTPAETQDILNLRERRNTIAHSKSAHMDNATYENEITVIKDSIESIANSCGRDALMKIRREIENIMNSPLNDNMGRTVLSALHSIEEKTEEIQRDPVYMRTCLGIYSKLSILHIACLCRQEDMCQYILSKFPNIIHFVAEGGWSAAHFAARGGNVKILKLLTQKGVPIYHITDDGFTFLHTACENGRLEMTQYILSEHPGMMHQVSKNGRTVAHVSSIGGHLDVLQLLLKNGININHFTNHKFNILHIACASAHFKIVQYVISNFSDMLHVVNTYGWNVAHCAAHGGDISILQLVIEKGLQAYQVTNANESVLHIACSKGHFEMCQYIISKYPDMLHLITDEGENAVHKAAMGGNVKILLALEEQKCQVFKTNEKKNDNSSHSTCLCSV